MARDSLPGRNGVCGRRARCSVALKRYRVEGAPVAIVQVTERRGDSVVVAGELLRWTLRERALKSRLSC